MNGRELCILHPTLPTNYYKQLLYIDDNRKQNYYTQNTQVRPDMLFSIQYENHGI